MEMKYGIFLSVFAQQLRCCGQQHLLGEILMDNLLERYVSLFPEVNLEPKARFVRHYPDLTGCFGPLIKTLHFEVTSSPYLT